jgi:hypothetical protein
MCVPMEEEEEEEEEEDLFIFNDTMCGSICVSCVGSCLCVYVSVSVPVHTH